MWHTAMHVCVVAVIHGKWKMHSNDAPLLLFDSFGILGFSIQGMFMIMCHANINNLFLCGFKISCHYETDRVFDEVLVLYKGCRFLYQVRVKSDNLL